MIDYVRQMAEDLQEPERNDYCVLLIVTDGGIKGEKESTHALASPPPKKKGNILITFGG